MEEDKARVRAELIQRRVEGDKSTPTEMVKSLQKKFPGISKDLVHRLESHPTYIDDVLMEHEASLIGEMKDIYDIVVAKAKDADIQFVKLYFSLLKDRTPQKVEAQKNVTNNILVTAKDPGDLYAQYKSAAQRVDTDRESPGE